MELTGGRGYDDVCHYTSTHIMGTTGGNTEDLKEAIRLAAQGTQRERYLLEKALSLYQQSIGRLREAIAHLIRHFQANLDQGDRISRERVYRHVQHYFQSDPFAEDFWADPEELEDTDEDTEDEE